jgi:DeoR/GlpR family transcriptional regulator of sugar metabolism
MLSAERKREILESIGTQGRVLASELSQRFGVSEDTIRRDLRELAADGLLHRVHGGALALLPRSPIVASHAARVEQAPAEKAAIAEAAAKLLRSGQVVTIDGGTTPLQVAEHIPGDLRLTVVTHSLPVLRALAGREGIELIAVGGRILADSLVAAGPVAVDAYRGVRADVCILGVTGVDVEGGLTALNHEESMVKRAMAHSATQVVAVAAADKLGTAGPFVVVGADGLTHLVTDRAAQPHLLDAFRAAGIEVITA